jgi:hypothetical protein
MERTVTRNYARLLQPDMYANEQLKYASSTSSDHKGRHLQACQLGELRDPDR